MLNEKALPRAGCYHCFKTLDPNDFNQDRRVFVRCTQCGFLYHKSCHIKIEQCYCGHTKETVEHTIVEVPPIKVLQKQKVVHIKPSAIYKIEKDGRVRSIAPATAIRKWVAKTNDIFGVLLGAIICILLAGGLGAYTTRILAVIENNGFAVDKIFDSLLKQTPPSLTYFFYAGITSLIFGVFLLVPRLDGNDGSAKVNFFTKFFAASVLWAFSNVFLMRLSVSKIASYIDPNPKADPLLLVQLGAVILIFFLSLIYLNMVPSLPSITNLIVPQGRDWLVLIWYLVISGSLVWLNISVSDVLSQQSMSRWETTVRINSTRLNFFPLEVGAYSIAVLIILLIYSLPKHISTNRLIKFVRRLLIVVCIGTIAYTYRLTTQSVDYLNLTMIVGVCSLLLLPLHTIFFSKWANQVPVSQPPSTDLIVKDEVQTT